MALSELDLEIGLGSILVVMGPNGAGKSTLVDLLTGYLRPSAGRFWLNGQDLTTAPRWKLARSGIARTFQVPRSLGRFTVAENVRIAARNGRPPRPGRYRAAELTEEILAEVGLETMARSFPADLSLGALRRLELARALATRPALLLADEPLGGLANDELDAGIAVLQKLARPDRSVMVIEHTVRAVLQVADEVAFLHHGRLLRRGIPAEVLGDQEVVEAYLGARLVRQGLV
ncbi:MAG: ABC transporter ATP-binding protein [Streptosporangiaceae bacterium]